MGDERHDTADGDTGDPAEKGRTTASRRTYLEGVGATTAAAVAVSTGSDAAAVTTDAAAPTDHHGIEFDQVVNAVDDLGMDPDGDEPIDDALEGAMEDGTLVEFPPGDYRFRRRFVEHDLVRWGLRGLGQDKRDVRFFETGDRPDEEVQFAVIGNLDTARDILFENVTFDQGTPEEGGGNLGLSLSVDDGLEIHDVAFDGFNPSKDTAGDREGDTRELAIAIESEDGVGHVEGVERTGGSEMYPHGSYPGPGNSSIVGVGTDHVGTVYFRDCHFENGGTHAMYATNHTGAVRVENCFVKNTNLVGLRVGGPDSWIRDCRIVIDTENAEADPPNRHGQKGGQDEGPLFDTNLGIFWQSYNDQTGGLIEDTDIVCKSYGESCVLLDLDGSNGAVTLRNVNLYNEADGAKVFRALDPAEGGKFLDTPPDRPWGLTIEDLTVVDRSTGDLPAMEIRNRPGTTIDGLCLTTTGRDGLRIEDSDDVTVRDAAIDAAGEATSFANSDVTTETLSRSADCSVPTDTGPPADDGDGGTDPGGDGSEDVDDGTDGSDDDGTDDADAPDDGSDGRTDPAPGDLPREFRLSADGIDADHVDYTLTVTGEVAPAGSGDTAGGDYDSIDSSGDRTTVEGVTGAGGQSDTFAYSGRIAAFSMNESATPRVDGQPVPRGYVPARDLVIEGDDTETAVEYRLVVEGAARRGEPPDEGGADSVSTDGSRTVIDGVTGYRGASDAWILNGRILDLQVDGPATVTLAGEVIDPAEYGPDDPSGGDDDGSDGSGDDGSDGRGDDGGSDDDSTDPDAPEPLPNRIVFDGRGSGVTAYEVGVSGDLRRDDAASDTASLFGGFDEVRDSTATGTVVAGRDVYRFSGDLTTLNVAGDAEVRLSDEDG